MALRDARLVGISGPRHHGKDSVADVLVRELGFRRAAFADPLKRGVMAMFGFTEEQVFTDAKNEVDQYWGVTPAWVLQVVGTECFRETFAEAYLRKTGQPARDFWVKRLQRDLLAGPPLVVSDARFTNELSFIRNAGGVLIRVERPGLADPKDGRDPNHASEREWRAWTDWDAVVVNDSTLAVLGEKVRALWRVA